MKKTTIYANIYLDLSCIAGKTILKLDKASSFLHL